MTIDANLEIRKLPPSHISQLSSILEYADQWKKLMAIVPSKLFKENFECLISCENPPKYNSDHIRVIETASQKYKRPGTEILLDEWGCSGRIRPAVGHLLYLLTKAELFRAADYVAVQILHANPPQRPSQGPAALINTNLNGHIIGALLDKMGYDSSLIENIPSSGPDINIDINEKCASIPAIIVTPDADKIPNSNFQFDTNENNASDNVSSMIKFSSSITSTSSLPNLPVFDVDSDSQSVTSTSINSTESIQIIPNISILNYQTLDQVPNLSIFDQSSVPEGINSNSNDDDLIPNLSGLHQPVVTIPNFGELLNHIEAESVNNNTEENLALPKLSLLIENSRRSSLEVSANSSKSRSCTSPLPNLTLKTNLPHFAYEEIEAATNDFNEEPYKTLENRGRFLGEGAFGKVFLATQLLNRPVAVKKIILENVEVVNVDDAVTKQFKNEVEVLSKFKHENLLSILGYSCDGCTYCLVYEYISGGTLKDRLQDVGKKLLWDDRLPIALGTAKAISYLHTAFSSPLIHRDIKTANILLDPSNKPKLGDFGITKLLNNPNTNTCTVIGTSAYMAPEALRGDISVKCDTFSFGVVLLELLTSLPTFDENRDGNDLVTHVEETCEDSIQPLLDTSIGSWIKNDVNFSEKIYTLAVQCLEEKKRRPEMVQVTKILGEIYDKL